MDSEAVGRMDLENSELGISMDLDKTQNTASMSVCNESDIICADEILLNNNSVSTICNYLVKFKSNINTQIYKNTKSIVIKITFRILIFENFR